MFEIGNTKRKVLFIDVHPDDETLGCGGTILKHAASGDEIHWLIITAINVENGWDKQRVESRQKEIFQVSDAYGFSCTHNLGFPTTMLDTIPMNDLISSISKVIMTVEPGIVYLPNRSDIHTDHQTAFKAVASCTKSFRYPFVKRTLMYECLSETEFAPALPSDVFVPNVFVDISAFLEKKIEIMKLYQGEHGEFPFPRSVENIKALARYRGATAGIDAAEAFVSLKEII